MSLVSKTSALSHFCYYVSSPLRQSNFVVAPATIFGTQVVKELTKNSDEGFVCEINNLAKDNQNVAKAVLSLYGIVLGYCSLFSGPRAEYIADPGKGFQNMMVTPLFGATLGGLGAMVMGETCAVAGSLSVKVCQAVKNQVSALFSNETDSERPMESKKV
jgi:hypothetical protein